MTILQRICGALLLASFLALTGCPGAVQQGGAGASQPAEQERGGE